MSDINLIIRYDNGNLDVVAKETEKKLGDVGKKAGFLAGINYAKSFKSAGGAITGVIGTLAKTSVKAFAVAGAVAGAGLTKAIADSAQTETIETQFRTLLKSGQRAQELVQDLQEFGATTPFELRGLSVATTQLLSFGIAQDRILPTLRQLGDVSAGVGANIEDLTIPFGRLVATQKLTLIELDKFADRGAVTYQQLADKAGVSIRDIRNEVTKGNIPFEVFTKVLEESTQEGGKFFNSMGSRSRTLEGALSNLQDSFTLLSSTIGKAFRPIASRGVLLLAKALDSIRARAQNLDVFTDIIDPVINFGEAVIRNVVRPFEIVFNVASKVGNAIGEKFSEIAGSLFDLFLPVIELANKALSFLGRDIIKVSGIIKEMFVESNESGFFEGVLEDTTLTDNLLKQTGEARTIVANLKDEIAQDQADLLNQNSETTAMATEGLLDQYTSIFSVFRGVASSALSGVGDDFKTLDERVAQSNKTIGKFTQKTGQAFQKGIAGASGQAFAELGKALQSGENGIEAFGKTFLKAIGNTLIQQGTAFILEGTAYTFSANPALQAKGPGLIGAGSAMAVFGGILGASVSGGSSGGGGGGGGTASGSTSFQDPVSGEFIGQVEGGAEPNTVLNINVEGNVVDQDAFTRRLVEQIGDEGGKQGLVFNNFATV